MKTFKRLLTQVPACLMQPLSQIINVIISILFALVFLTAYEPFSNTAWFQIGFSDRFVWTVVFVGVSSLFLALSRILMTFVHRKVKRFSLLLYICWLLIEIIIIGSFHSLISWFLIGMEDFTFGYIYMKSLMIALIALGFPYMVTDLVILLRDTRRMLNITSSDVVVSDEEAIPAHAQIINITDNNGNLKLSVKLDNLYYIKAEDNYVKIFYMKKGSVASYLLRSKLQTIEQNCQNSGSLMRCHRSYIVNIDKVSVLQNETDGFVIDFDQEGLESIPVSKTYSAKILETFGQK